MAVKTKVLGTTITSNQTAEFSHDTQLFEIDVLVDAAENSSPFPDLAEGSKVILFGVQGGDDQGMAIGEGFCVQYGYVSSLSKWAAVIRVNAQDYQRVISNYPTSGSHGLNWTFYDGIQIPDGELWTIYHVIHSKGRPTSLQATVRWAQAGADAVAVTSIGPGDQPIGTDGDITVGLARVDVGSEGDLVVIYDDGKS